MVDYHFVQGGMALGHGIQLGEGPLPQASPWPRTCVQGPVCPALPGPGLNPRTGLFPSQRPRAARGLATFLESQLSSFGDSWPFPEPKPTGFGEWVFSPPSLPPLPFPSTINSLVFSSGIPKRPGLWTPPGGSLNGEMQGPSLCSGRR